MRLSLRTLSLVGFLALSSAFLQPVPSQRSSKLAKLTMTAEADRAPAFQFGWVGRAIAVAGMWLAPAVTLQQGAEGGVRVERMVANAVPIGGVDTLNKFLLSVRDIRTEMQSEQEFDVVGRFNQAFDVEKVTAAVDGALDTAKITDQTLYVEKRKIIDKVLRAVVSDVVSIEDSLRDIPASKTGIARLKKIDRPLGKLETDIQRLTRALTSEDSADAAGVAKPLFSLCPDGYLLCD